MSASSGRVALAAFSVLAAVALLLLALALAPKSSLAPALADAAPSSAEYLLSFSNLTPEELAQARADLSPAGVYEFPRSNLTILRVRLQQARTGGGGAVQARGKGALRALSEASLPSGAWNDKMTGAGENAIVHALLDVSTGLVRASNYVWTTNNLIGNSSQAIAILDTGLDATHSDVNLSRVIYWHDYVSGNGTPYDDHNLSGPTCTIPGIVGHGTHVMGTAAGAGVLNASLKGVAPASGLSPIKVLDNCGLGTLADLTSALSWIAANAPSYNITVASMSLGLGGGSINAPTDTATNALPEAGVVVVCAAGNDGPSTSLSSPANAAKCIAVAATTDGNKLTQYSSTGTVSRYVDISAPGGSVISGAGFEINSTMSNSTDLATAKYHELAGTSMAAPHVAGAAHLIIEAMAQAGEPWAYAEAQALKVKMLLLMTASETNQTREGGTNSPTPDHGPADRFEGFGKMNADGATDAVLRLMPENNATNFTFQSAASGRKVVARKVSLVANRTANFFLVVPSGPTIATDLFLYSSSPNSTNGNPVILASSAGGAYGRSQNFSYVSASTATAYLVAKMVAGSDANASLSAISLNVTDSSTLLSSMTTYDSFTIHLRSYNESGSAWDASLALQSSGCLNASASTISRLALGDYAVYGKMGSSAAASCAIWVNGTTSSGFNLSTETFFSNVTLRAAPTLSFAPSASRNLNLASQAVFNATTNYSGADFSVVANESGTLLPVLNLSSGVYSFNATCASNGTRIFNVTASKEGYWTANSTAVLSCFEPFSFSGVSAGGPVWMNENSTFAANVTNVGAENLTGVNYTVAFDAENSLNLTAENLTVGGVRQILTQWNATTKATGTYYAVLNASYPGHILSANASFSVLPAFLSNVMVSANTTVTIERAGTFSSNATDVYLPPYFYLKIDLLSASFQLNETNSSAGGPVSGYILASYDNQTINGTNTTRSVFVNSSFPLANYTVGFPQEPFLPAAHCAGNCTSAFAEFNASSGPVSFPLPGTFASFQRRNLSISEFFATQAVSSAGTVFVSGKVTDGLGFVPAAVSYNVAPTSFVYGTYPAGADGSFAFNFTPPLAGSYTLNVTASYGAAVPATNLIPLSVSPSCGNGACEAGETPSSCCKDCGGCGGGSDSWFFVMSGPPKPGNATNVSGAPQEEGSVRYVSRSAGSVEADVLSPPGEGPAILALVGPVESVSLERPMDSPGVPAVLVVRVSVREVGEAPDVLPHGRIAYSLLSVETNDSASISGGRISFRVAKAWLSGEGVRKEDVVLERYSGGRWVDLPTRPASEVPEADSSVLFEAKTPGFSTFAIVGTAFAEEPAAEATEETLLTTATTAAVPQTGPSTSPVQVFAAAAVAAGFRAPLTLLAGAALLIVALVFIGTYFPRFKRLGKKGVAP